MITIIKNILLAWLIGNSLSYAVNLNDKDFDGVPDSLDQCPNTPFLNTVNEKGCTTTILMLPLDEVTDSLVLALRLGYSFNNDFIGRESQKTSRIRMTYYKGDWSYALRTGYFIHNKGRGQLDTTVKVKRRFRLAPNFRLGVSMALRLPTYDFVGNNTDISLLTSFSYYPRRSWSLFGGLGHTFIRDEQTSTPLQNTNYFYFGSGYFFTKKFYVKLSYTYSESKFTTEHAAKSISTVLFYEFNEKWFTTLSYNQDVDSQDNHNSSNFTIGYRFW